MLSVRWNGFGEPVSTCPVCEAAGAKRIVLRAVAAPPAGDSYTIDLLQCPACGARYADPLRAADYVDADRHGLKFYLEQGAGIRAMLEPLSLVDARPIRRYLEIGCSFGFVMDYARRILGWQVRGFDPGFIAAAGREELRLPIENAYFASLGPGDDRADLLFCSEVIEHIAEPGAFLAQVRDALAPEGILLLTTPNGDALSPGLAEELLLPLLSPGQHVILYSGSAIAVLLRRAGFQHIRIVDAGHQLRVAASAVPFDGSSPHFSPALYHRYLAEAAAAHDAASPLGAGFVCRLLKEEVGARRYLEAQALYLRLRDGYLQRFGFDIDQAASEDLGWPAGSGFREFSESWPCNLAGVWYSRGLVQLLHEEEPEGAARSFSAAIRFGAALRGRLHAIGTDDAETARLCQESEIARLHSLVRFDPAMAVVAWQELAANRAGSDHANSPAHRNRARCLLFAGLVQLGHHALAERVLDDGDLPVAAADDPDGCTTDFACGLYLLNHRADFAGAAALLERLRARVARLLATGTDDGDNRKLFQEIEIAWLSAAARGDPPRVAAGFGRVSGNLGGLDCVALPAHRQRVLCRLFTDLVNLGHYDIAEQILEAGPDGENSLSSKEGAAGFAWGVYLLNHRADFAAAAAVFARVWQQARDSQADGALLWAARFHQGLASRYHGDAATAAAIAAEIGNPGPEAPPIPDAIRARVDELIAVSAVA